MPRLLILAAALLLGCADAHAQAPEKRDISIGYAGAGLAYSMVPLAQKYFPDEGLSVSMKDFSAGGTQVLQALVGGSVDLGLAFYDHTINMQALHKGRTLHHPTHAVSGRDAGGP